MPSTIPSQRRLVCVVTPSLSGRRGHSTPEHHSASLCGQGSCSEHRRSVHQDVVNPDRVLVGFAGAPGGYGIYAGIAVAGGYAGGFAGPVLVVGDFTATGGAKSAAVPHPDGTHRRLYCMESPESLFEDFGKGRVANGRGEVKLDADFAALVHGDDYHIFLTPRGESNGLYVSGLTSSGFEVREQKGGASSLDFDYRIVAKRKDIPAPWLEKVKLPEPIKELVKPDLPTPPWLL